MKMFKSKKSIEIITKKLQIKMYNGLKIEELDRH